MASDQTVDRSAVRSSQKEVAIKLHGCLCVQVLKTQLAAKQDGFADVVYLDAKHDKYLEEVSSCNIFVVKGKTIRTPALGVRILCKSHISCLSALDLTVIELICWQQPAWPLDCQAIVSAHLASSLELPGVCLSLRPFRAVSDCWHNGMPTFRPC